MQMGSNVWARYILAAVMSVLFMVACSSGTRHATPSSTRPPSGPVNLVAAPAELRNECAAAANQLGFAVPCPAQVPKAAGRGMRCPVPESAMPAPCVGLEGLPPHPAFGLDFSGFDVPSGYQGVDGKAMGHLYIEARPRGESPPSPCIGARRLGTIAAGRWTANEYSCSSDTLAVQREARHGEGAYLGHLLFAWSQDGIDYIASAHGHTIVNRDLLVQLVGSMTLIPPTNR
jgi:hypothetical protein